MALQAEDLSKSILYVQHQPYLHYPLQNQTYTQCMQLFGNFDKFIFLYRVKICKHSPAGGRFKILRKGKGKKKSKKTEKLFVLSISSLNSNHTKKMTAAARRYNVNEVKNTYLFSCCKFTTLFQAAKASTKIFEFVVNTRSD